MESLVKVNRLWMIMELSSTCDNGSSSVSIPIIIWHTQLESQYRLRIIYCNVV
jgi:hypothetical protein